MRERRPAVIKQTVRAHHTPASVSASEALTAGALHDLDLAPGYAPTAAGVFGEHAERLAAQYRELNQRLEAKARRLAEDHATR